MSEDPTAPHETHAFDVPSRERRPPMVRVHDPETQRRRMRAWAKKLGWTLTNNTRVFRPTLARAEVHEGVPLSTELIIKIHAKLEKDYYRLVRQAETYPRFQGGTAQERDDHKRKRFEVYLAVCKARRLWKKNRKRYMQERPAGSWTIDTTGGKKPHPVEVYECKSRVHAYSILCAAAYAAWEAEWDSLSRQAQRSRILQWGRLSSPRLRIRERHTLKDVPPGKDPALVDYRYWQVFNADGGKDDGLRLHGKSVRELIGEDLDWRGLTTEQMRKFMRAAKNYRGGFDLPDGAMAHAQMLTFLPLTYDAYKAAGLLRPNPRDTKSPGT